MGIVEKGLAFSRRESACPFLTPAFLTPKGQALFDRYALQQEPVPSRTTSLNKTTGTGFFSKRKCLSL